MKVIYEEDESRFPTVETTLYKCFLRVRRRLKSGKKFKMYVLETASGEFTGPLERFDPDAFSEGDRVLIRYVERGQYKNFLKVEKAG